MKRNALRAVLVNVLVLALGSEIAGAIELRSREAAPAKDAAEPEVIIDFSVAEAATGGGIDATDLARITAPATDGTYTGTVAGDPFTLTVAGNRITGWEVQNLNCPSFTVTRASISTSCSIAGNNTFSCGGLGCTAGGNMRIIGSFSGNTVSGTFDFDFQPPGFGCCSFRNLSFTATRVGGSAPAAPSNLVATATSDDEVELDWNDNANNETEFRVEMRQGTSGAFTDIGAANANATGVDVIGLDPATLYQFRVRARNANGDSAYSNTASATTLGGPTGPCVADGTTLCLAGGRFKVRATFETSQPQSGQAQVVLLTPDTGYMWFFSSSNVEVVLKVLNACGVNNRYWVFAGGLTDVRVDVTVTDTQTGAVKTYSNPLGTRFAPIQDTSAFATCP
jgi:hypothetical protein